MIEKNDWNPSSHLLKLIASACTSSWKGLNHWKLPVRYLLINARVEIEEKSKAKQKVSSFQFISTFLYVSLPFSTFLYLPIAASRKKDKSLPGSPQWWGAPAKRRQSCLGSKPLRHLQASTILHLSNFTPFHSVSLPFELQISNFSNDINSRISSSMIFNDLRIWARDSRLRRRWTPTGSRRAPHEKFPDGWPRDLCNFSMRFKDYMLTAYSEMFINSSKN